MTWYRAKVTSDENQRAQRRRTRPRRRSGERAGARLAEPWTLNSLADEVHLSRSQLAWAFDATVEVTRGRQTNIAYVATDEAHLEEHQHTTGDDAGGSRP